MSCPACFQGAERQDKVPSGHTSKIHGRNTYTADPPNWKECKGIILIVPDAFGWEFVNNRLLADEYARKGQFKVYLPDFMDGTAAPLWVMDNLDEMGNFETAWAWITKPYHLFWATYGAGPFVFRNRLAVSMPKVCSFISSLRSSEATHIPIGVAGFCWGGQHIVRLASQSESAEPFSARVDALFTAHPSMLSIPQDIEGIRNPIGIAVGDKDHLMPKATVEEIETILRKNEVLHKVVVYEGAGHGFSVRIDRKNPRQAEQAEQAEKQAVDWFVQCFERQNSKVST